MSYDCYSQYLQQTRCLVLLIPHLCAQQLSMNKKSYFYSIFLMRRVHNMITTSCCAKADFLNPCYKKFSSDSVPSRETIACKTKDKPHILLGKNWQWQKNAQLTGRCVWFYFLAVFLPPFKVAHRFLTVFAMEDRELLCDQVICLWWVTIALGTFFLSSWNKWKSLFPNLSLFTPFSKGLSSLLQLLM